jgi:hypothetical protein
VHDLQRQLRGSIGASKLAQREPKAIFLPLGQFVHPPSAQCTHSNVTRLHKYSTYSIYSSSGPLAKALHPTSVRPPPKSLGWLCALMRRKGL